MYLGGSWNCDLYSSPSATFVIALIVSLDTQVLASLFAAREASVVLFMANLSMFGEWTIILPLTAAIAGALLIGKHRAEATGLMVAVCGSSIVVIALKYIVARPRPEGVFRAVGEIGYSFPSAHAALSVALFGFLCYLLFYRTTNATLRRLGVVFAATLSFMIGFSRLYLGVHYLSDIVAGFAIGGVFLWLGILVANKIKNRAAS